MFVKAATFYIKYAKQSFTLQVYKHISQKFPRARMLGIDSILKVSVPSIPISMISQNKLVTWKRRIAQWFDYLGDTTLQEAVPS